MKIIQVRGTSGSGKSTVMAEVIEELEKQHEKINNLITGRKKPLYYQFEKHPQKVIVLGHYEAACGGCDTIGSAKAVFDLILSLSGSNQDTTILCEGLLLSEDTKWTLQLRENGHKVKVLFLTTLLPDCLSRIISRRAKVGNDKPLNPDNTSNRFKVVERAYYKLQDAGIEVRRCRSDMGAKILLHWTDSDLPKT